MVVHRERQSYVGEFERICWNESCNKCVILKLWTTKRLWWWHDNDKWAHKRWRKLEHMRWDSLCANFMTISSFARNFPSLPLTEFSFVIVKQWEGCLKGIKFYDALFFFPISRFFLSLIFPANVVACLYAFKCLLKMPF